MIHPNRDLSPVAWPTSCRLIWLALTISASLQGPCHKVNVIAQSRTKAISGIPGIRQAEFVWILKEFSCERIQEFVWKKYQDLLKFEVDRYGQRIVRASVQSKARWPISSCTSNFQLIHTTEGRQPCLAHS